MRDDDKALSAMNDNEAVVGADHSGVLQCPNGHAIPGAAAFCPTCGVHVNGASSATPRSGDRRRAMTFAIAGILLMTSIAGVSVLLATKDNNKTEQRDNAAAVTTLDASSQSPNAAEFCDRWANVAYTMNRPAIRDVYGWGIRNVDDDEKIRSLAQSGWANITYGSDPQPVADLVERACSKY
jgi:hypothetical protein